MFNSTSKEPFVLYMVGGIGNQLFQFSTAYSYAKKYNRELVVNINLYSGALWNETVGVEIHKLIKDVNIEKPAWYSWFFNSSKISVFIGQKLRGLLLFKGKVYKEEATFIYSDKLMQSDVFDGVCGYFQSALYFEDYKDDIKFMINLPIHSHFSKSFLNKIRSYKNTVAIHYRDYADSAAGSLETKKNMGDMSINYYKSAMLEINQRIENPIYFIFSNNIDTAKKKFHDVSNVEYFDYKSEIAWEDMALMAHCSHNIIANSSYSWWAAYLNQNKDKIVIAPKKWGKKLEEKHKNNLFVSDWILL
jgi:hypothetical protein